jgi:hypothetical protein
VQGPNWKEYWMETVHSTRSRPWLATAAAVVLIAIAGLLVPISYERTTGHDVSLAVTNVAPDQMKGIATELKSAIGVEHVMVNAEATESGTTLTFEASVPASNGVDAGAVASAFANGLKARGFGAVANTTPVREKVSGNVYAYARDRVIRVETSGKTAAQIEAEIRDKIAAAGLTGTTVSVKDEGNKRTVKVEAQHFSDKPGEAEPENLTLELTKDGQPVRESMTDGVSVQVKRLKSPSGETMHLDVSTNGQTAGVDIPNANTMSDAALADAIKSELAKKGMNVKVTVTAGQIQIEKP